MPKSPLVHFLGGKSLESWDLGGASAIHHFGAFKKTPISLGLVDIANYFSWGLPSGNLLQFANLKMAFLKVR